MSGKEFNDLPSGALFKISRSSAMRSRRGIGCVELRREETELCADDNLE